MSIHSRARDRPWGWSEGHGWSSFLSGSDQAGAVGRSVCLGRTSEKAGGGKTGGMQAGAEGSVGRGAEKKGVSILYVSVFVVVVVYW